MKKFSKILALVLSVLMLAALGAVLAADVGTGGTAGAGESVTFKKAIKITNNSGYCYEPDITYTYAIEGATTSATVSDGTTTVNIKSGSLYTGTLTSQTAVYSRTAEATSGANDEREITFTFDPTKFPSAGVYRFKITETNNVGDTVDALAAIGITRSSDYDTEKYLDVYVGNGSSGLQINGYALVDDENTSVTKDSVKSAGFVDGDDLDQYDTYNITVTKVIDGDGADKTQKFPFEVALTGDLTHANVVAEGGTGDSISLSGNTVTGALGNGKTIVIKGIPKSVTFTVSEDNPTTDEYKVTSEASNISDGTTVSNESLTGSEKAQQVYAGSLAKASGAVEITVTNSLSAVSPTGVVMRVAPFVGMMGGGIALLGLSKRSRKEEDED